MRLGDGGGDVLDALRLDGADVAAALAVRAGALLAAGPAPALADLDAALADVVAEHAPGVAAEAGGAEAWVARGRAEGRVATVVW